MKRSDAVAVIAYVDTAIRAALYPDRARAAELVFMDQVVDRPVAPPPQPTLPKAPATFVCLMLACGHLRMVHADMQRKSVIYCDSCGAHKMVGLVAL